MSDIVLAVEQIQQNNLALADENTHLKQTVETQQRQLTDLLEEVQRAREECESTNEWYRRRARAEIVSREMVAQRHKRNYEQLRETYRRIEEAKGVIEQELSLQTEEYKRLKKEIRLLV